MTSPRLAAGLFACLLLGPLGCRAWWTLPGPTPRHRSAQAVEVGFESPGGLVVVPLRIGDDPTVWRFVVDTEQSGTLVAPALAARLGLRPRHVRIGTDYYGAYRDWTPILPLPSLWIAGFEFKGGKAEVVDLDVLSQQLCRSIDGVLGIQFPEGLVYEIDYAASVLRLARSVDLLPVRSGGLQPDHIDAVMADGSFSYGVDVASTYPGIIEVTPRDHSHGVDLNNPDLGAYTAWPAAMLDEAIPQRIRAGKSYIFSRSGNMRLGATVLQAFIVRGTYRETWLYPNGRALPRGPVSFGFTWTLDGGEATITDVHSSTRALGLTRAARVLAIDDQVLATLTPEARCRLHRDWESARDTVRVTLDAATIRGTPEEVAAAAAAGPTLVVEVPRRSLLTPAPK